MTKIIKAIFGGEKGYAMATRKAMVTFLQQKYPGFDYSVIKVDGTTLSFPDDKKVHEAFAQAQKRTGIPAKLEAA